METYKSWKPVSPEDLKRKNKYAERSWRIKKAHALHGRLVGLSMEYQRRLVSEMQELEEMGWEGMPAAPVNEIPLAPVNDENA